MSAAAEIQGHVNAHGHCWGLSTHNANVAHWVNVAAEEKGYNLHHGGCPATAGDVIHTWSHHGVTVREYGAGQSEDFPLDLSALENLDETIHAFDRKGNCH